MVPYEKISQQLRLAQPLEPLDPFKPFDPFNPRKRRPMPKRPFEVALRETE